MCYSESSQITLAAPWLGAEEGVGRTTKKNEQEKPTVPCLSLTARLPRPWPSTEWRGSAGRKKKSKQTSKRDYPGPSTDRGGSVGRKKKKRRNQAAQPNHTKDAPNLDIKLPKHLKQPKEKNSDPKAQKLPETTQGEEPIKPENCRVRRRRESQLITAASLESSTLRWISRENALASWTYRHQEPRTAPVEVV